jgi:membrane protein
MTYKIRKRILQIPSARSGRNWLKKIKFKKHDNISLYRFLKIFFYNIQEDEIMDRSNGVAFNFILAMFPTIIFLFTLIPYISNYFPDINKDTIMSFMGDLLPASMYQVFSATILDIISNQRGGLLTVGFVLAVFLATNGMMTLMRAFNACYRTIERRNWFRMRFIAGWLTLFLSVVVFSATALLVVGQLVLNKVTLDVSEYSHFRFDHYTIYFLLVLRFVVIFIVFFIAISFIYYFGPAVHYNWHFFSIGGFVATLGCLSISYGFSYYVTNFAGYNKVYGSIGALLALMVWVQLLTAVLLFGYEINASLHYARKVEAIDSHRRKKRLEKAMR